MRGSRNRPKQVSIVVKCTLDPVSHPAAGRHCYCYSLQYFGIEAKGREVLDAPNGKFHETQWIVQNDLPPYNSDHIQQTDLQRSSSLVFLEQNKSRSSLFLPAMESGDVFSPSVDSEQICIR